jgi:hypothetical protein
MTKKRSSTQKQGMHGEKDLESGELAKKAQQMHADAASQDEGGRASVSDAESGEEGIRAKGLDAADASDDAIDRVTRSAPPLSDNGSRRE